MKSFKILLGLIVIASSLIANAKTENHDYRIRILIKSYDCGDIQTGILSKDCRFYTNITLKADDPQMIDDKRLATSVSKYIEHGKPRNDLNEEVVINSEKIIEKAKHIGFNGTYSLRFQLYGKNAILPDEFVKSGLMPLNSINGEPQELTIFDPETQAKVVISVQRENLL